MKRKSIFVLTLLAITLLLAALPANAQGPVAQPISGRGEGVASSKSGEPWQTSLQVDTNVAYGYSQEWQAGDQLGVVLRGSSLQYPLSLETVEGYLYWPQQASVQLQAHIYALDGTQPGALLGSSGMVSATVSANQSVWVSLPLTSPVWIEAPQPFLVAIEYLTGVTGTTPAVVQDISTDIPHHLGYFRHAHSGWNEHYAFWAQPAEVGYSMIRVWAQTAGGPGDETVLAASADTILSSGQPTWAQGGVQHFLIVGDYDPAWGQMRALLRFPLPQAPLAGAVPISATLRLYNYYVGPAAVTVTLPLTSFRATTAWNEASASWATRASSYAEAYGSTLIPASAGAPRERFVPLDVLALVGQWLQGTPNNGIMLIGGEDVPFSARRFYAREGGVAVEKLPRLLVKWALPTPTSRPSATPTIGPSPTPTATVAPRRNLYLPLAIRVPPA